MGFPPKRKPDKIRNGKATNMDEFYVAVALRMAKEALSATGPAELMALWDENPYSYPEMVQGIHTRIKEDLDSLNYDIGQLTMGLAAKKERARRCEKALREMDGSDIEAWYKKALGTW